MDSGTPSSTPWAFYDPATSSLRTSAPSLLDDLGWTSSSLDLPRSGSMLSGRVYERPTSVRPIVESGGSSLLGTPTANVYEQEVDVFVDRARRMKERHGNGNGAGTPLSVQVKMLPTPRSSDGPKGGPNQTGDGLQPAVKALLPTPCAQEPGGTTEDYHARREPHGDATAPADTAFAEWRGQKQQDLAASTGSASKPRERAGEIAWGNYTPAINRWERTVGRPAPAPTDDRGRLSPRFVEWMMGLPDGWVTGTEGLSRSQQLTCLGNGVVPQQAAYALSMLTGRNVGEVAA